MMNVYKSENILHSDILMLRRRVGRMRIKYMDYTKGLAIILMIFGHTMTKIDNLHLWIYSFHMPLFFIVSGMLMQLNCEKNKKNDINKICKKIISIAIPYYFFGTLLIFFYTLLNILSHHDIDFYSRMFSLLTLQGIDSLWFLPIYLFTYIVMAAVNNFGKNKDRLSFLLFIIAVLVVIFASSLMITWYSKLLYKFLIAFTFCEIGVLIKKYKLIDKIKLPSALILFVIGSFCSIYNGDVEMSVNHLGNPFIYYFTATSLTTSIIYFMHVIENKSFEIIDFLMIFGRSSIVLLVTNNLIIETIRLIDFKICNNLLIKLGLFGSLLFTLIILIIEWNLIKFANGPLGVLFGKINVVNNRG